MWPARVPVRVSTTSANCAPRRLIGAITSSPRGTASAPPGMKSGWMSTTSRHFFRRTGEVAHEPLCSERATCSSVPGSSKGASRPARGPAMRATRERAARLLVQLDDARVLCSHDEQRRRLHAHERGIAREVRAAAARDHRADALRHRGRDAQRAGRAVLAPNSPMAGRASPCGRKEAHRIGEPRGEERDIEAVLDVLVLLRGQKIEQQRRHLPPVARRRQNGCAASGGPSRAVRERHHTARLQRQLKRASAAPRRARGDRHIHEEDDAELPERSLDLASTARPRRRHDTSMKTELETRLPQVGAPDPELDTSPIIDESEYETPPARPRARCATNEEPFALGAYVQSGAEVLQCTEHGVWVRKGEKRPA